MVCKMSWTVGDLLDKLRYSIVEVGFLIGHQIVMNIWQEYHSLTLYRQSCTDHSSAPFYSIIQFAVKAKLSNIKPTWLPLVF